MPIPPPSPVQPVPGSFRDPSGRVYQIEERVFRTVNQGVAADFEFVQSTGLIPKLVKEGHLLSAEKTQPDILGDVGARSAYVLEIPKLPFVSFPYEWSFSALREAALLHLHVHLTALQYGVTLTDASAYNVQFYGSQPIFIDHLSFRPYRKGEIWVGHRQFCEQFLNPLLLRSLFGISHNSWYRGSFEGISAMDLGRLLKMRHFLSWNILKQVVLPAYFQKAAEKETFNLHKNEIPASVFPLESFRKLLKQLYAWVMKIHPADTGKTVWQDYTNTHHYTSQETRQKMDFVSDFVKERVPIQLWDLGCNTGDYSRLALDAGAKYVVGFDFDHGALDFCFSRAREENLLLQSLLLDAANPTPNQGWNEQERLGLKARASASTVLALALVHHLAISRNIPMEQVVEWIISLAPNGVIEFVPKTDPMVQRLLRLREDIFPDYLEKSFLCCIDERARILKTQRVSPSGRLLVSFERR